MLRLDDVVLIQWDDTVSRSGWESRRNAAGCAVEKCRTVGYLVGIDGNQLTVVATLTTDEVGDRVTIPLGCITSVHHLELGKKLEV